MIRIKINPLTRNSQSSIIYLTLLAFICSALIFYSCVTHPVDTPLGHWISSPSFRGHSRAGAFCFTIGNTAYIGLGHDGFSYRKESYAYSIDSGYWKKIATFPGAPRERCVSFTINGIAYVGTGYNRDSTIVQLNDFWSYDPARGDSGTWTRLKDFGGGARFNAVGFSIGDNGYLGTGYGDDFYNDFWRYDPVQDQWSQLADIPGTKRQQALAMNVNGKAYLCCGTYQGSFITDLLEFDPATSSWTDQAPDSHDSRFGNFKAAVNRYDAVTFTLDNKAYIGLGSNGAYLNTIYQFDPVNRTWTRMNEYEKAPRSAAVAFVIGGKAYVGTGGNSAFRFDNIEEFSPN